MAPNGLLIKELDHGLDNCGVSFLAGAHILLLTTTFG